MTTREEALPALCGPTHFEDCCGGRVLPSYEDWRADVQAPFWPSIDYGPFVDVKKSECVGVDDEIAFEVYDDE